ncbi:hypothetical protein BDP27DRAFT_1229918 [Rhodocollybia butyracea]|uniref:Sodium/calcium exchanger membrane region domain-containing protein n=1 Tax=Rhodocollybia butyracea TaxID=206335 RepID=A0A9P5PML3_9AGAR|nr:hypothetical protein BDP27DRAFT_1229918 [Rhodocollybia butyracea]
MHSVLDIHKTHIQILHASFRDYLLQKSRSGPFYIGDSTYITRLFLSFHTARVTIIHPGQLFVLVKDFDVSQFRDYIPWRLILVSDFSNILFLYFFAFAPFLTILLFGFALLSTILNWDVALRFSLCFFATANLAKLLGEATERVSVKFGETHAGIFKMSFRNMSEVILGVSALLQGKYYTHSDHNRFLTRYMLGFILCNVLLVLGGSFLAAGLKFPQSNFGVTSTQVKFSMSNLRCTVQLKSHHQTFVIICNADLEKWQNLLIVSRVTAIMLLGVYLCYLYFQLKSHAYLFETELEEQEEAQTSVATTNLIKLAVIASIEGLVELYNIPKHFIGLFLIPLANASKYGTPVWMAVLGQMDTTISFCIGNSIQLAAFVVPLLVILGWILGQELTLFFNKFETIIFFVSIYLAHTLIMDGQSNCLEGLILITLYLIIGLACESSFHHPKTRYIC